MDFITSPNNRQIAQIRALRRRRERDGSGLFLAEGLRIVMEALTTRSAVECLVVAPDLLTSDAAWGVLEAARRRGVPRLAVSAEVFRSLSTRDRPAGLAAVVRQRWDTLASTGADGGCWVALTEVQDPGNLGTVLRTADAAGAAGVILVGSGVDPYHPTAVRASMGALFSRRIVRASAGELVTWAARHGCRLIGASGAGDLDYRAVSYRRPLVLVMGSERQGLGGTLLGACAAVVRIPMLGRSDSLNLAVAASLLLYEALHQDAPGLAPPR
jgi:TrmH family RNA methyltransferase